MTMRNHHKPRTGSGITGPSYRELTDSVELLQRLTVAYPLQVRRDLGGWHLILDVSQALEGLEEVTLPGDVTFNGDVSYTGGSVTYSNVNLVYGAGVATAINSSQTVTVASSQNLTYAGNGTVTFDLNSVFSQFFRWGVVETTLNTHQNEYDLSSATLILRINATGNFEFRGIKNGFPGRPVWFQNVGSGTITIKHESASAVDASYRVQTPQAADFAVKPGEGVMLWYDDTSDRWRLLEAKPPAVDGGGTANRYTYWSDADTLAAASIEEQSSRLLVLKKLSFASASTAAPLAFVWFDDSYRLTLGYDATNEFVFDNNLKYLDILNATSGHYRCRGNIGQTGIYSGLQFTGGILTGGALTASTLSGFEEAAQDAVGAILTNTATIDLTYNDAAGTIAADVKDNAITPAKLNDGTACSVLGRSANSAGDRGDIAAAANDQVLRRTGDALDFGQLTAGMFPANVVSNAALRQSAGLSVLGRAANSTGDVADITAGISGHVLRRAGTALAFGELDLSESNATTGVLAIARGGTGATSFTSQGILYGGGVSVGSTAAGTDDQVLKSQGGGSPPQFEWLKGEILGLSHVATEQTTTSTSATDLTTTQHVTFTLTAAQTVLVRVGATSYNTTAAAVNTLYADVDGTDTALVSQTMDAASAAYSLNASKPFALGSGSHTIKLQFAVSAGTGGFKDRTIEIVRA